MASDFTKALLVIKYDHLLIMTKIEDLVDFIKYEDDFRNVFQQ